MVTRRVYLGEDQEVWRGNVTGDLGIDVGNFTHGGWVTANVWAVDRAGNFGNATWIQVLAFLFPPEPLGLYIYPPERTAYQQLNWSWRNYNHSTAQGYYTRVGTSPGLDDVVAEHYGSEAKVSYAFAEDGRTYYAAHQPVDCSGTRGPWSEAPPTTIDRHAAVSADSIALAAASVGLASAAAYFWWRERAK